MKIILTVLISSITAFAYAGHPPLPTVNSVDLERYVGKWYEIARFDQSFQKGCTATTATYSVLPNGDIEVVNRCRLDSPNGELKEATGVAWVTDEDSKAKLKVQFFLTCIRLPFLAGNYWILALDEDYQYALIGDPSREYLWILNRAPNMDPKIFNELVDYANQLGFDTSKLLMTQH